MHWTNRRRFLRLALGGGASLALGGAWLAEASRRQHRGGEKFERTSRALGANVTLTVLNEHREAAEAALDAAFAELELVEDVMSLYRPHSQLARLNREQALENPHPYFVEVLTHAQQLARRSGGAFDVTVQPLWDLHAAAQNAGRLPQEEELAAARAAVDWRRMEVSSSRIRLDPGMAVTLNGIAQGFAADRALAALRRHGIEHALVDAGELGAVGEQQAGDPWTVGIQHPRAADAYVWVAKLDGRCLATSGDYATRFTPDRRDHHIFDPRTGRSPADFASVSVLAESGLAADALSTALFVVGLEQCLELIAATPGADALFVLKDGRTLATPGFPEQV